MPNKERKKEGKQRILGGLTVSCDVAVVAVIVLCPGSAFAGASMERHISEVDGSEQPYGLYIPEPFDPDVPHPGSSTYTEPARGQTPACA